MREVESRTVAEAARRCPQAARQLGISRPPL
jgi:hypothetical protein